MDRKLWRWVLPTLIPRWARAEWLHANPTRLAGRAQATSCEDTRHHNTGQRRGHRMEPFLMIFTLGIMSHHLDIKTDQDKIQDEILRNKADCFDLESDIQCKTFDLT